MIVNAQHGSTSSLQRRFKIGYSRAGRIMDMLEEKGIVGPQNGSKPREVLIDASELEQLKALEDNFEPGPIAPSVEENEDLKEEVKTEKQVDEKQVAVKQVDEKQTEDEKEKVGSFDSAQLIEEDIE